MHLPTLKQGMKRILDAKYTKADLKLIAESSNHLDSKKRNELYTLLKKYESLFNGNLGTWHGKLYDIKIKPDAEKYHGKLFTVQCVHELTFKQGLDQLKALKVIKKVNRSQWGARTSLIPRKYSTVHFIFDFRELKKCILRQPYPITMIQYILLRLEGFRYGTTSDLYMGYYCIQLSANYKEMCIIITQWGKYAYQRLPMGLCNSTKIFQEKLSELFVGLETVRVYIDELLHVKKGSWKENLTVLKEMFTRLQKAGLKVNASKSCFWRPHM